MTKDPICGMDVDPKQVADSSEYQGKTYSFCSLACKLKFDEKPERYAK